MYSGVTGGGECPPPPQISDREISAYLPGKGGKFPGLPKNMWRVCVATLTPIFKPPVTEWPPFYFSHFART